MTRLMRFPTATRDDPDVAAWWRDHDGPLGTIARHWFAVMRRSGEDVRELLHDGQPTACVGDAAFAYVDCHRAHVTVGFFLGAWLDDPQGLLQGSGKFMRHVKRRPDQPVDDAALAALLRAAYDDMRRRVGASPAPTAEP